MSQTITTDSSSGVTLTDSDTTIAASAHLTTGPNVENAVYGTSSTTSTLTVTNYGTLIGSNFDALELTNTNGDAALGATINNENGAPVRLIVDPGATFTGTVTANASNASNTIELAKGNGTAGTLAGLGSAITHTSTSWCSTPARNGPSMPPIRPPSTMRR